VLRVGPGTHIAYNPRGEAKLELDGQRFELAADHGLRLDAVAPSRLAGIVGCLLVASIT
jgi:hypothetical protein